MLAQQAQDAVLGSPHVFEAQPSPDLAVPFASEKGLCQQFANLGDQFFIGSHLGAALLRLARMLFPLKSSIETGPRQVPDRRDPRHTVRLLTGRRNGATHGFDFQNAKGRPFSRRAIFSRSSSFSTLTLATTDFKRRFSSSSMSDSRLFRLPSPPARKRSRHSMRVAAVTRYFREVLSRSAPRRRSSTTETLRLADHRPAPARADDSGASSVALRAPSDAPESCFLALDMHSLLQNILYTKCSHCTVQRNSGPGEPILHSSIKKRFLGSGSSPKSRRSRPSTVPRTIIKTTPTTIRITRIFKS